MIFKNLCVPVLLKKEASALEGLIIANVNKIMQNRRMGIYLFFVLAAQSVQAADSIDCPVSDQFQPFHAYGPKKLS